MKHSKRFLVIAAIMVVAACVPSPWEAWRYEHKLNFGLEPGIYLPIAPSNFHGYCVGGAFVQAGVVAHNQTTRTGTVPYALGVTVKSKLPNLQSVTFHSVSIRSSLGEKHVIYPISVMAKTGRKIERIEFPVKLNFRRAGIPNAEKQGLIQAHLTVDSSIELQPEVNEVIEVTIDVEIFTVSSSERKAVTYEFFPRKDSGFFK